MKLTERLLGAAQELSEHARATVAATDDTQRATSIAAFNETKARLGELVDEISTELSADPQLQQAASDGVSTFVVSGVKATRLAERGRIEEAQRELQLTLRSEPAGLCDFHRHGAEPDFRRITLRRAHRGSPRFLDRAGRRRGAGA